MSCRRGLVGISTTPPVDIGEYLLASQNRSSDSIQCHLVITEMSDRFPRWA